jgi:hypothetical protein
VGARGEVVFAGRYGARGAAIRDDVRAGYLPAATGFPQSLLSSALFRPETNVSLRIRRIPRGEHCSGMTPAGIIMHGHCRPVGNQNITVSVKVKTTGGPEPLAASVTCMRRRPALTPGTARSNSTYGRLRWVVAVTYAPCWRSAIRWPGVRSMHVALNLPPTISSYLPWRFG